MIKKIAKGVYRFVAETGKNLKKAAKEAPTALAEDLLGITTERKALKSREFKLFKKQSPVKASEYEQALKKRLRK